MMPVSGLTGSESPPWAIQPVGYLLFFEACDVTDH